mmetsp:Transcript_16105/g.52422  ORF Transcript_16105/g.52422 Transcript_16105/m.52422 type:complete len:122 (+) Transcript_16105:1-366(+)
MACLYASAFSRTMRDKDDQGISLVLALVTSLATIASGLVGLYLNWETFFVKAFAFLYLSCALVSRVTSFVVVFMVFGLQKGIAYPALAFFFSVSTLSTSTTSSPSSMTTPKTTKTPRHLLT